MRDETLKVGRILIIESQGKMWQDAQSQSALLKASNARHAEPDGLRAGNNPFPDVILRPDLDFDLRKFRLGEVRLGDRLRDLAFDDSFERPRPQLRLRQGRLVFLSCNTCNPASPWKRGQNRSPRKCMTRPINFSGAAVKNRSGFFGVSRRSFVALERPPGGGRK